MCGNAYLHVPISTLAKEKKFKEIFLFCCFVFPEESFENLNGLDLFINFFGWIVFKVCNCCMKPDLMFSVLSAFLFF